MKIHLPKPLPMYPFKLFDLSISASAIRYTDDSEAGHEAARKFQRRVMQRITPFLWFDTQAEEAANFYVSIFKNSRITSISRYPEGTPGPVGQVMVVNFELDGQKFIALNGGPTFKFTEAISLLVNCETQQEIDHYWTKLTAGGGNEVECGWLKDKYGLSWQIVPANLEKLLGTPEKAKRVMAVVMKSKKLNIAEMERAAESK